MRFDVDSLAAEYVGVTVTFRGVNYDLGTTTDQVLGAVAIAKTVPDNAPVAEQFAIMPQVLAALNPELGLAVGDGKGLSLQENLIFQKCIEAAMKQINSVPFRPVA